MMILNSRCNEPFPLVCFHRFTAEKEKRQRRHLLAMMKSLGMSVASFSFTASDMGPKITTGLLKPADRDSESDSDSVKRLSGGPLTLFSSSSYLLVRPPSRRRGTWWPPGRRSGPRGSCAGPSSWLPSDLSASRSLPCRCRTLPGRRSGRWTSAPPCQPTESGSSLDKTQSLSLIFPSRGDDADGERSSKDSEQFLDAESANHRRSARGFYHGPEQLSAHMDHHSLAL